MQRHATPCTPQVWDAETEMLTDMADADEAARYADGVRRFEFDAHLAPYDLSSYRAWASLSGHVTEGVIASLSPVGGCISIMAEGEDPDLLDPKTAAEAALVKSLAEGKARVAERLRMGLATAMPGKEPGAAAAGESEGGTSEPPGAAPAGGPNPAAGVAGAGAARTADGAGSSGRCFYTRLPRLIKAKGMSPSQLTAANMDKSAQLVGRAQQGRAGHSRAGLGRTGQDRTGQGNMDKSAQLVGTRAAYYALRSIRLRHTPCGIRSSQGYFPTV
jgi:A1 cistron-splicing factor AAR2